MNAKGSGIRSSIRSLSSKLIRDSISEDLPDPDQSVGQWKEFPPSKPEGLNPDLNLDHAVVCIHPQAALIIRFDG